MQSTKFKVFVGGLSYDTTDESLTDYFKQFGAVQKAIVMRNQQKQSRGFGFCVFQEKESFDNVLKKKYHIIDNRSVDVREALSKNDAPPPQPSDGATKLNDCKLFVGGLHYQTNQMDLINYFKQFGTIESATVVYNHETKKSRGFGFVIFQDLSSVQKVREVPKHVIMGREVEVKAATPKSDGHLPPAELIKEPEHALERDSDLEYKSLDRNEWDSSFSSFSTFLNRSSTSDFLNDSLHPEFTRSDPLGYAYNNQELRYGSLLYGTDPYSNSFDYQSFLSSL